MIKFFIFGAVTVCLALFITPFGGLGHLKGIKNSKEREKIRLKALGVNLTVILLILSAIFIAAGAAAYFREYLFKWFMIGWFVLGVADAIFISKSNFYFKDKNQEVKNNEKEKIRNQKDFR